MKNCEECSHMRNKIPLIGVAEVKDGVLVKDAKLDYAKSKAFCRKGIFANGKGKNKLFSAPHVHKEWSRAEECMFYQEA